MSIASCCLRGTASVVARTSGSRSLDFALGTRRTSHAPVSSRRSISIYHQYWFWSGRLRLSWRRRCSH